MPVPQQLKTLVVRAFCPHKVYLTQAGLAVLYSDRYDTQKVFTKGALLVANTPYYLAVPCSLIKDGCME
ncbi:hypothetical protein [Dolichospermum circinale]|uniref:hypothetical protein n=1 Tax=Dolichospermum circinale TaxID=109265 RepID=UPI00232CF376|nr:hypothetical protein [Dolichospermum circinale]MDB9468442.1 hypothetical protein [Dolichospermum circinale CS-539/09]MDB9472945.1 hypothetical protein [Dolichospermum circinale CS-539]